MYTHMPGEVQLLRDRALARAARQRGPGAPDGRRPYKLRKGKGEFNLRNTNKTYIYIYIYI